MSRKILLLSLLLVGWIALSSFWYTCKIKGLCLSTAKPSVSENIPIESDEETTTSNNEEYQIDSTLTEDNSEEFVDEYESKEYTTENFEEEEAAIVENVAETSTVESKPYIPKVPCPTVDLNTPKPSISDMQFGYASDGIYCTITLRKFAIAAKRYLEENGGVIEIVGHTDNGPKQINNFTLGLKRAISVKKFLIKEGIPADYIETNSRANTQPIGDNNTPEGRQQNRRVSIKIN